MKNILCLSLLFFSHFMLTQEYHVAKNGDDLNPGTKDKPFLTITFLLQKTGISNLMVRV
tara:strand:+ start:622 stop:798 length:177 start_codon:yes stop_codon:yes gene_type:complete